MRKRLLTWHVHGSYLAYLARINHDLFVPVKPGKPIGYGGRPAGFERLDNVHEVPAEIVGDLEIDCVLYQSHRNYLEDRFEILSSAQQQMPQIFLEHDPPRESPTDTRHPVDDPTVLLVHVTPFNDLMWDSGRTPMMVIDHGVVIPAGVRYEGTIERGIVVVNDLARRGRRLGRDVFERVRREVPLDLIGMGSQSLGGLGEVPHAELPGFIAQYRFFFNPIRYTSLGLAVCEAMLIGMPIVGLATTELAAAIENGVSGYVDTNVERLIPRMHALLADPVQARSLGAGARHYAAARFDIARFAADWDRAIERATALAREDAQPTFGERSSTGVRR